MTEAFLLNWLSKEDSSIYGECRGIQLSSLISKGEVKIIYKDLRGEDYNRVALTEKGWISLEALRAEAN